MLNRCLLPLKTVARSLAFGTITLLFVTIVSAAPIDFERDIRPILNDHCASCHGGVKASGGFSILSRERLTTAADSGSVPVQPGNVAGSELLARITSDDLSLRMPPEGHDPLSPKEIELLTEWIRDGAEWPVHWSHADVPPLPDAAQFAGQHPIDWCVRLRLSERNLAPAPRADRHVLVRRMYLDLTGLLPTPSQVSAFVESGDAAALADELLSSPHFGERWGRHWLDEARYADSEGYEKDSAKDDAWRYRDWVVRSINDDMPFDDFTRRQIAGDLLPNASQDDLIATKFQLQTQFNLEGGVDSEEDRTKRVIDTVGTVGTVWLATSVGCTQCHNHPYDPLEQTDFYRLYAFFNNTDLGADFLGSEPTNAAELRGERREKWAKIVDLLNRQVEDKDLSDDCQRELSQLRGYDNGKGFTRYMTERQQNRRATYVFTRGDFQRPQVDGGEIAPNVPRNLGTVQPRGAMPDRLDLANWLVSETNPLTARVAVNKIWLHLFGRSLADQPQEFGSRGSAPSHPQLLDYLARSFMDNGWSRKALIRLIVTSQTYQQSSSHRPELVSFDPDNRLLARQNRFRVEAEIVRDISLQAAGLLSRKAGGPSVFPPLPEIVAQQTYAGSFKFRASEGEDRYRRGLYTFFRRTAIDPNLSTFDCPDSSLTVAERDRSNNPLQALATLHNEVYHEAAQAFARRLLNEFPGEMSDADRLDQALRITVGRSADDRERAEMTDLLHTARDHFAANPDDARALAGSNADEAPVVAEQAAWINVCRVLLNLDEFLTRS
ncbi:MAG: PSD1 and planctomycete cytochrome C domain-containing protein [Planctomycetaceae bacterium]